MGKRDRKSDRHSRNKSKKKAKRSGQSAKHVSLAYRGNKYRTEELVRSLFSAEVGIYESFVMTDRELIDRQVRLSLERLILQIRRGTLPDLEETGELGPSEEEIEDFVIWNIRRNWQKLFQIEPHPGRDNLVGVLRTILGSIEVWGSIDPASRGYLQYIEGFLKEAGVSVRAVSPDHEAVSAAGW